MEKVRRAMRRVLLDEEVSEIISDLNEILSKRNLSNDQYLAKLSKEDRIYMVNRLIDYLEREKRRIKRVTSS